MIRKLIRNRQRSKWVLFTGASIWIFFILYFINSNYYNTESHLSSYSIYNIYDNLHEENESPSKSILSPLVDNSANDQQHISNFKNHTLYESLIKSTFQNTTKRTKDLNSNIYDDIFTNHKLETVLGTLSFKERCDLYFKNVFAQDVNWHFNPDTKYDVNFDKKTKEYQEFNKVKELIIQEKFDKMKQKLKEEDYSKELEKLQKSMFTDYMHQKFEQEIVNRLSTFRIFNKCYITNDETPQINKINQFITNQQKLVQNLHRESETSDKTKIDKLELTDKEALVDLMVTKSSTFEHRVYPWISKEYPVYERWTGKVYHEPPNYYEILNHDPMQKTTKKTQHSNNAAEPFLKQFKNKFNGRGIVLTIGNQHSDYAANLIHLLRALDNKLPIQIVYYDDVNEKSKRKIVTAAQEDFRSLPHSFEKVAHLFGDKYINSQGKGLQPQEVWFVNAYNSIHKNYRGKFSRFGNKLLASLFNSFSEFILIDVDTVLMQPPEFFFQLKNYQTTGTYFFKDRSVFQKRSLEDGKFFERMGPSTVDQIMFDIPIMTNYTTTRELFRGLQHYMESGLVMINKDKHLNSILMITQINLIGPITGKVWGDKELFWLGFAINGDEEYYFDNNFAAAIGELTPPQDRARKDGTWHHSKEICTPHPGHISSDDNHSLLWINSGFRFCHQADEVDFEKEAEKKTRLKHLQTADQFRTFYYNPLRITHAIVPPLDPDLQDRKNAMDEPTNGWFWESGYCRRYMWCAYSSVGGPQKRPDEKDDKNDNNKIKDNTLEGILVEYNQDEIALFDYLGDIWVGTE
ncbi:alpha-1,3-mannosyltransferase, putative [Candida dubliniensis CD36]|uniref:Alpha-1,3-mannosyltransferase, putative n=1 Tax=Candida dubliniensis (strain CD36 / ATCC MYA-646 / CBS 7987 / NCPF 3949 / NRRL Y-17841) TaxID=573826 RepID=B9WHI2_CANDC|nr:alpha-1,3-mannosyltransferase, putative [Candida dubliniensis CD36]CAX41624.1 alpha-1,3-mannosyltransferase, putative [Candida dubliniensis CD36]